MTTVGSEPRPGTAFKKIVEEQAMMDEFMAMIKKKLEADKRYLDELIDLKATWNPKWNNAGVWELMSPMLGYLTEEIGHLTAAQEEILARFTATWTRPEPVSLFYACEDRTEPLLRIGKALEKAYVDCEACRQSTCTPEAQGAIAQARTEMEEIKEKIRSHESLGILLPVEDRAYRIAVDTQHRIVSPVREWYANKLPGILEQHQQRAEDIKALLVGCCGSLGKLASDFSASCSLASHSTQAFATARFIAPRHSEIEREKHHLLFRKFEYRNTFDGRIVKPIFGLGPERTLTLANQILDAIDRTNVSSAPHSREIDWIFDLEEQVLANQALDLTTIRPHHDLYLLLKFTLWSDVPLIPISSWHIDNYPKGVPRKKLRQIVDLIRPELRGRVMALLKLMWSVYYSDHSSSYISAPIAVCLCHTQRAWVILNEIWRKWDFEEDRPLQDGVMRNLPGQL